MELKDAKIEFYGTTYTIKIVDTIEDPDNEGGYLFGTCDSAKKLILVARNVNGNPQPNNEMELTLYHELFHAIMNTGQYLNSNNDEPLIEWLARCLYKILHSKLFKQ